jgi:hypothetical protein
MAVQIRRIGRSEDNNARTLVDLNITASARIQRSRRSINTTQSLSQKIKNSNTVCLILVILSGLLFVGYLQNAHYGWSGRVLSSADALEVNNEIVNDYGVVMDCGSSGTRVFVYTWPRTSHEKELLQIEPLKGSLPNFINLNYLKKYKMKTEMRFKRRSSLGSAPSLIILKIFEERFLVSIRSIEINLTMIN